MLTKAARWTEEQSKKPHAMWTLAGVSFVESSFFPIPPDVILIPMVLSNPKRWWMIALVCTIASVLGGILGYAIGLFFFDTIAMPALEALHKADAFHAFRTHIEAAPETSFLTVAGAGFTPFPFKVITIASGAVQMALPLFIVAAVISRGARFFLEAALLRFFGQAAVNFLKERMALASTIIFLAVIAAFVAYKMLGH